MAEGIWFCTRQRAGPLVKECRALRPDLSRNLTAQDAKDRSAVSRNSHTAVCRTQLDRLELRLALFGYEGSHYTLTFDPQHLPSDFAGVRKTWRAFMARAVRFNDGAPFDWIYCIEGLHGDHRYHIHTVLRDSQFPPSVVRYLWRNGIVDDEPVLKKEGGYRRLAEYFNKERTDGFFIPIGRHPWSCSRSLNRQIPQPEKWRDDSGLISIPDDAMWARRGGSCNDFGSYYYGSYILRKGAEISL